MRILSLSTFIAVWAAAALAAPSNRSLSNSTTSRPTSAVGPTASSTPASLGHQSGGLEYVVLFNSSTPEPPQVEEVLSRLGLSSNHSDVRYTFNNSAFRGFAANMNPHCINALSNMTDVSIVEEAVHVTSRSEISRSDSPWGLQRISSQSAVSGNPGTMSFTYSYNDPKLGSGVDIYVVDTGINTEHAAFGGRARMGFSFEQDPSDQDGHGTHVSGTAASAVFGVASQANLIGVKVLGANGTGLSSDTIAGMDWVIQQHDANQNDQGFVGSIMSMSWGLSGVTPSVNQAVAAAVQAGIHVSVAAGNDGKDACNYSPSSAGGSGPAITVGSIGMSDDVSSFSNTGSCVDVFAPGEDILSTWIGGDNVVNILSGTSMATPHVTGVMAYLMASNSTLAASPAALKQYLTSSSMGGAVKGDDANGGKLILNNGVTGAGLSDILGTTSVPALSRRSAMPYHAIPHIKHHVSISRRS
ncbi:MAG: hypothetical protein M1822_000198 [Bathelium mastoideum]|nr:MAG: hypothetical protein M1822_000198 [Bathelium mastoideum]